MEQRPRARLPQTRALARTLTRLIPSLLVALSVPDAWAAVEPSRDYYVYAPVLDVQPIMSRRTVERPVRQCTSAADYAQHYADDYPDRDHDHHGGGYFFQGLLGGLVGGVIGNQFGGGNGKKVMTVLGAVAGSSIAREAARQHERQRYRTCTTSWQTETIDEVHAYDVTYEYAGRQFTKRTDEHPGDSVRVRVEVSAEPGDD